MKTLQILALVCLLISVLYTYAEDSTSEIDSPFGDSVFDSAESYDKRNQWSRSYSPYSTWRRSKTSKSYRRGPICMRWNYPCVKRSVRRFARCCGGLQCSCSAYGGNCRCVSRMGR